MKQTTKALAGVAVLAVVAAGVGGVAWWANKDEQKKTEAKEKSEKLFDFDKSKARALRVEKNGALLFTATRAESGWTLTAPIHTAGDGVPLNAMVEQLSTLKQKKDLGAEKNAGAYGLDKPQLRVTLTLDGGDTKTLELGADNPFDNTLYVRRSGDDTIRVVEAFTKGTFDKSLFDLREKRILPLPEDATVTRIEVTGVKMPYTLEKDGAAWKLLKPAMAADASTADRIVSSLRNVRATAVAAESAPIPAQYGLALPRATAKLTTAAGTRTVVIGQVGNKTYAKRDDAPTVYEIDAQPLKDLTKDLFELEDKQLVHFDREQVRRLALETAGGVKIELARQKEQPKDGGVADETFTLVSPKAGPAKKWKASSALYTVAGLRAAAFEQPKASQAAQRTITVYGDGDKVLARVRIFGESGTRRYVQADGSDRMALVEKSTLDDLPWKLEDIAETPAADAGTPTTQASAK